MKAQKSKAGESGSIEGLAAFVIDAVVVYASLELATHTRFGSVVPTVDLRELRLLMPLLFLSRLGSYYAAGIYRRSVLHPRGFDTSDLLQAWATGTVILSASVFFTRLLETSRLVLLLEAIANVVLLLGWRMIARFLFRTRRRDDQCAIFRSPSVIERINRFLELEGWEFRVKRSVASLDELYDDEILIIPAALLDPEIQSRLSGRRVYVMAGIREIFLSAARPLDLGGLVLLETGSTARAPHYMMAKRAMDFSAALVGLAVLWPVLLIIALLVRLTSRGPAIYSQIRVGKGGAPFRIFKFRTMAHGAFGPLVTDRGDPRITPLGGFLRRWSLDELPQLVNVLFGSLSLVGPRPEIPELVARYPDWRRAVLDVPPGITGLVQVAGRDELTEDEKARQDLFYALHCSFEMDVSILIRTFRAVIKYGGRF